MTGTRIEVTRRTARWDPDAEVSVKEAMDFWSFAGAAANVVMQLASPGVGYGVVESKVDSPGDLHRREPGDVQRVRP
jgi:uncharacterized protein (DUF2236 family)